MLRMTLNEFLKHSKASRGFLGQASKQAGKHLEGKAFSQSQACKEASKHAVKQGSRQALRRF